jgi:GT2 family glycosyltransferase
MPCPDLADLPPPPPGKTGWPWTEASTPLPATTAAGGPWPRVTVVTPSFNQAAYVEATLRSVLLQGYPELEYIVLDGGSTDGSVEIIRKYERWLTCWASRPDGGQSAAIDEGLRRGTGAWATWINSDDMLHRDALATHAARFAFDPSVIYVGDCVHIDAEGRPLRVHRGRVHSLEDLLRIRSVWRARGDRGHIVQPEVLFPRRLALDVGSLDRDNHRTMDYDLWGRLLLAGATVRYTGIPFGMFRLHAAQKTSEGWRTTQSLVASATRLLHLARELPSETRAELLADLRRFEAEAWARTGRLARFSLPPALVTSLRRLGAGLHRRLRPLASRGG